MTGVISMLVVVIKNKQMEYIKQNETKLNKIKQIKGLNLIRFGNLTDCKVWVRFCSTAEHN